MGAGCFSQECSAFTKDPFFKKQKICGSSSALLLLTGNDVPWAWGVPIRSVLHLQKTRCLEGAGKAALELDAACPSLTRFQFHVYSNASCGSQFQSRADFSALTKSSEDFETAEALRLELPRAPSTRIPHLKLPRVPSTQNLPSDTPSRHLNPESPSETPLHPFNKYSKPLYISKSKVTDVSTSRPLSAAFLVS